APYVPEGGTAPALAVASVVGLQTRTIRFRVEGVVKVVAARLRPWGALFLVREGAARLSNRVSGLGPEWRTLARCMRARVAAGDFAAAVRLLERFLLARGLGDSYSLHVIREAANDLDATRGTGRMTDLARRSRLSVPQLRRGFRRVVGTTPKAFARTLRFDRAL